MKLNLFKRQKVENAADLESTLILLPKSGKELTLAQLAEDHDKVLNMHGYANMDHMIKVNDSEEMSGHDLVKKYNDCLNELKEMKEKENDSLDEELDKEKPKNDDEEQDLEYEKKARNDDQGEEEEEHEKKEKKMEKKSNSDLEKKKKQENFDKLKNAEARALAEAPEASVDLLEDRAARGKQLYGRG